MGLVLSLIVALVIVGVCWKLLQLMALDPKIERAIQILGLLLVFLWVLGAFGVFGPSYRYVVPLGRA